MPHCCNPDLGKGYYGIYERIKSESTMKLAIVQKCFTSRIFKKIF